MYSRLPATEDAYKDFWKQYNRLHADDHMRMAHWANVFAKAKGLNSRVVYYLLPELDFKDANATMKFFEINRKQHMMFYDHFNEIGQKITPPVFVFLRRYSFRNYDLDKEAFLEFEKEFHDAIWRAIYAIKPHI